MEAAIAQDPFALQYASSELRSDWGLVAAAVEQATGIDDELIGILQHASLELRSNRKFMLEMMEEHVLAVQYASRDLKSDASFQQAFTKVWGSCHSYDCIINSWDEDNGDGNSDGASDDNSGDGNSDGDSDEEPAAKRRRK